MACISGDENLATRDTQSLVNLDGAVDGPDKGVRSRESNGSLDS